MKTRFRLLPVFIFIAALTLSVKLGGLFLDFRGTVAPASAVAQEAKPAEKGAAGKGGEARPAEKKDAEKKAGKPSGNAEEKADEKSEAAPAVRFDPRVVTDSELDILQKLAERRAELDRRSRQLDTREKLLRATENRIEAKIQDLKQIQETISKLLVKHDKEKEAKMQSIVKIYEKMKPKEAARIFEELEMPILLDVLERMREAKTALIMANMSPAKAKAVTAALTQRRALPKLGKKEIN
jgi:flagellar motility protein MotE (MotC chaperone)